MSERGSIVEWAETVTEVIIVTEEYQHCDDGSTTAVLLEEQAVSPSIQNVLETMVQQGENDLYCGECHNLFKDQCDLQGGVGPSFVLDSPTTLGAPQRALLTLPHGLMIGRSSIPGAGLGVMNQGPAVSPGMHFGPYEGEITTREEAIESDYSWEICKRTGEYEYIDASRETHSNWMRYVNCARSEEEMNLLVVQCRGSVLFHCCRPIPAGEELLVWPSDGFLSQPSHAWHQIWFRKCTSTEGSVAEASQIFLCAHCPLSFTTESYLQRHAEHCHAETAEQTCTLPELPRSADHPLSAPAALEDHLHPNSLAEPENQVLRADMGQLENLPPDADMVQSENLPPDADMVQSEMVPSPPASDPEKQEEPNKCSQCGKVFMYSHHLRRHNQSVHLRTRPYCCVHCKRCFSQSSGLLRHQLTHQKRTNHRAKASADVVPLARCPNPGTAEHTAPEPHPQPDDPSPGTAQPPASEPHPQLEDPSPGVAQPTASEPHHQPEHLSDPEHPPPSEGPGQLPAAPLVEAEEATHKCSPCQRVFTNRYHLERHKQAVHSNKRPYCCSQCKRCFSQSSDLAKHLKAHQRQMKKRQPPAEELSTEDEEEENMTPADDDHEDPDPPFVAPSSAVGAAGVTPRPRSQRMKHLGSRSRLSAITRLIAPKRRQPPVKRRSPGPAPKGEAEEEEPGDAGTDGMDGGAESAEYSCAGCKGTFETQAEFKDHQCSQVRDGPFTCPKCQTVFKKYGNLLRHDRVTHSGKTYPCTDCGHLFTRPAALKRHREMDSCSKVQFTSEVFACSYCQYSFTSQYYLGKHVKRHHPVEFVSLLASGEVSAHPEEPDESHNCSKCGKTYGSFKGFKAHKCMKQGEILYLCTECGKGFSCFYALKQHHLFHTGEKPHRCPHCDKCFMLVGQLNVHIRTHTGEKPYLCTHCGESFRQSGDLKRHEGKHTGVRPHQCAECGKSFSRPQSLRAHQLLHSGQKLFKCTQCGKSFSRSYHLKRHHQKMHTY